MSDVNVLIATQLAGDLVERVRGVSPRLRVEYQPYDMYASAGDLAERLENVEVLVTFHAGFPLEQAPRLRWVQLTGDGINYLRGAPILESDVILTNARIFAKPIAEYVFASILSWCHRFPEAQRSFQVGRVWPKSQWAELAGDEVEGKTLAIVGYGSIGQRIARIAQAFDLQVIATRRSVDRPVRADGVVVYPATYLREVLARGDYVVVCLPLTNETEGIIGEPELRAMKPTAYLVNVGRGKVIDDAALLRALQERWIAGAGLDVHAQSPLPPDSPYFDLPNVILTPHISGITGPYFARFADLLCENFRRYLAGEPLLFVVDKQRGY